MQKIPGSSRLGQSIGMSLVFMLKEPCDGISIHDEYWEKEIKKDEPPAFLICNTPHLSLPTIYIALFVPELRLKLVAKKIIMAITVGVMCLS